METRDSGVIDLFAIHKEEERRVSEAPASTGALPALSFDTHHTPGGDADVDALAFAQQKSRKRAKIVGGAIGALAVIGILIAAIASGGSKASAKDATAAAALPPPAVTETVPAPTPAAAPPAADTAAKSDPAPPTTAKAADSAYSRKDAIAAVKKTNKAAKASSKPSGVKMQKVQSSGTN